MLHLLNYYIIIKIISSIVIAITFNNRNKNHKKII